MKKFKLNSFEKFVIGHKKVLIVLSFIAFFVIQIVMTAIQGPLIIPQDTFLLSLILLALVFYICTLPKLKNLKVLTAYAKLDLDTALEGASLLLDAASQKDYSYSPTFYNNKAVFLIETGNFCESEKIFSLIFQMFDTKKIRPSMLFAVHANWAVLKAYTGDVNGFTEQLRITESYYKKVKDSKNKAEIRSADYVFNNAKLIEQAYFGTYSEDFERKVLEHIKTFGGKEKKEISPYDYFSAYSILFNYFARFENSEKAVYYASEAVKLGNPSLFEYRRAKEYLKNANECN